MDDIRIVKRVDKFKGDNYSPIPCEKNISLLRRKDKEEKLSFSRYSMQPKLDRSRQLGRPSETSVTKSNQRDEYILNNNDHNSQALCNFLDSMNELMNNSTYDKSKLDEILNKIFELSFTSKIEEGFSKIEPIIQIFQIGLKGPSKLRVILKRCLH